MYIYIYRYVYIYISIFCRCICTCPVWRASTGPYGWFYKLRWRGKCSSFLERRRGRIFFSPCCKWPRKMAFVFVFCFCFEHHSEDSHGSLKKNMVFRPPPPAQAGEAWNSAEGPYRSERGGSWVGDSSLARSSSRPTAKNSAVSCWVNHVRTCLAIDCAACSWAAELSPRALSIFRGIFGILLLPAFLCLEDQCPLQMLIRLKGALPPINMVHNPVPSKGTW